LSYEISKRLHKFFAGAFLFHQYYVVSMRMKCGFFLLTKTLPKRYKLNSLKLSATTIPF